MSAHNLLQQLFLESAPYRPDDPGDAETLTVDRQFCIWEIETSAAETRTLAQPIKSGIYTTVVLTSDGGDLTLTVTGGYNQADDTTVTLNDVGDWVRFVSVKEGTSYYWRVDASEGAVMTVAAEHGAGVIGTGVAPTTSRYVAPNGEIITDIKVDLTGLASKNTANDVIGLAAGGAAYIGRNVVANNGVIHKIELICLETPAGGDNDVNVVANASGALAYDGAGGTTYGVNGGDAVAGQVVQNLVQGLTANHYFYLTAGTGDTANTYTAGQFIVRLHGHPLLA